MQTANQIKLMLPTRNRSSICK